MADHTTCKNCSEEIWPRFVNVGGPIGGTQDGWVHSNGLTICEGAETLAEPQEA